MFTRLIWVIRAIMWGSNCKLTGTVDLKHMQQMLSLGHDRYGEVIDSSSRCQRQKRKAKRTYDSRQGRMT